MPISPYEEHQSGVSCMLFITLLRYKVVVLCIYHGGSV